ncbi:MAG: hypothetical protein WDA71_10660 [Actinomycetota bacterium]
MERPNDIWTEEEKRQAESFSWPSRTESSPTARPAETRATAAGPGPSTEAKALLEEFGQAILVRMRARDALFQESIQQLRRWAEEQTVDISARLTKIEETLALLASRPE